MGNWMRLQVLGSCDGSELDALRELLVIDLRHPDVDGKSWDALGPLSVSEGLAGLGDWPATAISAVGNAFERDYDAESVSEQLKELVKVAPTLTLTVHCGGDYESAECVATVKASGGEVEILSPEISALPEISDDLMLGRMAKVMGIG